MSPSHTTRPPLRHWSAWTSTWFGVGLLPGAPGTWGSLAALPFAWLMLDLGGRIVLLCAAALLFFIGWKAAQVYAAESDDADPGPVVIDEVVGQWLALLAADPQIWWTFAVGFVLFRIFDIAKPWPAGWIDKQIKGGLGIMLDDLAAGLYALLGTAAVYAVVTRSIG